MVNENFGHGGSRLPLPDCNPVPNPHAHRLRVGDIVKVNCAGAADRRARSEGVILAIDAGIAKVRWKDGLRETKGDVRYLIKA